MRNHTLKRSSGHIGTAKNAFLLKKYPHAKKAFSNPMVAKYFAKSSKCPEALFTAEMLYCVSFSTTSNICVKHSLIGSLLASFFTKPASLERCDIWRCWCGDAPAADMTLPQIKFHFFLYVSLLSFFSRREPF